METYITLLALSTLIIAVLLSILVCALLAIKFKVDSSYCIILEIKYATDKYLLGLDCNDGGGDDGGDDGGGIPSPDAELLQASPKKPQRLKIVSKAA